MAWTAIDTVSPLEPESLTAFTGKLVEVPKALVQLADMLVWGMKLAELVLCPKNKQCTLELCTQVAEEGD